MTLQTLASYVVAASLGVSTLACAPIPSDASTQTPAGSAADPNKAPTVSPNSSQNAASQKSGKVEPGENATYTLLRGGRVMTATGVIYEKGDVLLHGKAIAAVGVTLTPPAGATIVDAQGKTITPGIIDTHSHMGVYPAPSLKAHRDGNEATAPVTAHVGARDGFWPQDPQIDMARAGGVTTIQVLPGSANLIGGRSVTLKLIPNARSIHDLQMKEAPYGLKMACGENPKRVYGDRKKVAPMTRMGNWAGYRAAFQKAVEYKEKWARYNESVQKFNSGENKNEKGEDKEAPSAPERDLGLETLVQVLDGKILVHNHCYRADEMSLMLELADEFGFKIRNFHHAVEAYKIADRLAEAGTGASVWADWWGFKAEAYDGVKENAAMLSAAGAKAIIHSDSAIGIQRLNQEAAKAMFSGRHSGINISDDEALRWITLNPAWSLGIDHLTGSLEAGKMADVVVWNRNPFSVYAKAEQVYIDGQLVYNRNNPEQQPRTDFNLGLRDDLLKSSN